MYEEVVFYNHGHLGDTLLAKPFIREIKKLIPSKTYAISNNYTPEYVLDIVDKHYNLTDIAANPHQKFTVSNNKLYINTWLPWCFPEGYLQSIRPKADDNIGYNFDVWCVFLNEVIKSIDASYSILYMLEDRAKYTLDTYNIEINFCKIPKFVYNTKRVLIFNQPCFSGQGQNIDYSPFIAEIGSKYPDVYFYTSQQHDCMLYNTISLQPFFSMPDLFKLAIFSTQCDIIMGPGNAPLIATWIKPNINNKNKSFIVMNQNDPGEARWFQNTESKFTTVKLVLEMFQCADEKLQTV